MGRTTIFSETHKRARVGALGAASVEAVITLPVLILIFLGVVYVSKCATGQHQAEALARECAWHFSEVGCSVDRMQADHPECGGLVQAVSGDFKPRIRPDTVQEDSLGWQDIPLSFDEAYGKAEDKFDSLLSGVLRQMVGGVISQEMTNEARAMVDFSVSRASLGGTAYDSLRVQYQLPCNLLPRTPEEIVTSLWDEKVTKPLKHALHL